jgi:hypothetical protein
VERSLFSVSEGHKSSKALNKTTADLRGAADLRSVRLRLVQGRLDLVAAFSTAADARDIAGVVAEVL